MKKLIIILFMFLTLFALANEAIVRDRSTTLSPFSKPTSFSSNMRANATSQVDYINCFEDETFEVAYTTEKSTPFGAKIKRGMLKNYDLSSVSYIETSSNILCTIDDYKNNFFYVISQGKNGVFKITKEDKFLRRKRESLTLKTQGHQVSDFAHFEHAPEIHLNSAEKISVDVMVVYDYSSRAWLNAQNIQETTHALSLVSQANGILVNSGITNFNFNLVSVYPANFDFTSKYKNISDPDDQAYDRFEYWLTAIQKGSHSAARGIHSERKKSGADIVSVVIYTGASYGVLGLGYALEQVNASGFRKMAFSLTNAELDASTFVHEIGHNMGAGHAKEQSTEAGPQYHPYSAGYYNKTYNTHTIMAYNYDEYASIYEPVPAFSSSTKLYENIIIGNQDADNACTLTELAPMVSNFTTSVKNDFIAYGCIGAYDDRVRLAWTKIPGVSFYNVMDKSGTVLESTSSTTFSDRVSDSDLRTFTIQPFNRFEQAWGTPATVNTVAKIFTSQEWITSSDTHFVGHALTLNEAQLPYDAPEVEKTPSFYMRYQDPFTSKMKKAAVVSRMPASRFAPLKKFYVETTGKINRANRKLINPHRREAQSFASLCATPLFQPDLNAYMFIKYKHVPFYTQTRVVLQVPTPEIESLTPTYNEPKKRWEIEIKGRLLSTKKPSVKLEYQYKNEFKTRSLSVISKPTYPNARGQLNKSYSNVESGESTLTVALPEKYLLNQTQPYTLILDNGTAFTLKTFNLPL